MKALQITQSNFGYWIVIYIPKESNSKMSNRQLSKVQRCCIFLLTTGQENRQLVYYRCCDTNWQLSPPCWSRQREIKTPVINQKSAGYHMQTGIVNCMGTGTTSLGSSTEKKGSKDHYEVQAEQGSPSWYCKENTNSQLEECSPPDETQSFCLAVAGPPHHLPFRVLH